MRKILILIIFTIACSQPCIPGQTFDGQKCVIFGCESQNRFKQCSSCKPGFELKFGICVLSKCKRSSSLGVCAQCERGYEFDQNFCTPKNSLEYDSKTRISSQCKSGFEKNIHGFCQLKNCQVFADDTFVRCSSCKPDYEEKNRLCAAKNCRIYNKYAECLTCESGYIYDSESKACVYNLNFCVSLNQFSGLCQECQEQFALVALRACVKKIDGCKQYDFEGCIQCTVGLQVKDHECEVQDCKQLTDNKMKCKECEQNFDLTLDKYCRQTDCQQFSNQLWECTNCLGRFDLINGKCRTKGCNFFERANKNRCQFCENQYTFDKGNCLLSNCLTPKSEKCDECVEGWVYDQFGECTIRDCATYLPKTRQCSSCNFPKRLVNGLCLNDNCLIRAGSRCLQCEKQFYRESSQVYCVPYFCKVMNSESGECEECWDDFKFDNRGLCYSTLCLQFNEMPGFVLPQCTKCVKGFQPFDRYCVPQNCEEFNNSICLKCSQGYQKINNICLVNNCLIFSEDKHKCQVCSIGYQLVNNKCELIHCQQKIQNQQKCKKCDVKYFLLGDICLAQNCYSYSDRGQCLECQQRFFITENNVCNRDFCLEDGSFQCQKCEIGYTVGNSGFCLPVGCQQVKDDVSGCKSCLQGFVKQAHYCVGLDCSQFDEFFFCKSCRNGFSLSNGKCIITSAGFCPQGQYFSPTTFLCQSIKAKNCVHADPKNTEYCLKCKNDFFLSEGVCYSYNFCIQKSYYKGCIKCLPGYESEQGICQPTVKNCRIFSDEGTCTRCQDTYYLTDDKKCFKIPSYCASLNNEGECNRCKDNRRVLRQGICYLQTDFCLQYNHREGVCFQCEQTHYLDGQFCRINPQGCKKSNNDGFCLKCFDKYISAAGKCHNIIQDCVGYNIDGRCSTCEVGFYLNSGGSCSIIPLNCIKVDKEGFCQNCRNGFVYVGEQCRREIRFCKTYMDDGRCNQCIQSYKASSSGKLCLLE